MHNAYDADCVENSWWKQLTEMLMESNSNKNDLNYIYTVTWANNKNNDNKDPCIQA